MEYTEKHAAHKSGLTGAEGFQRKGEMLPKKKKKKKEKGINWFSWSEGEMSSTL